MSSLSVPATSTGQYLRTVLFTTSGNYTPALDVKRIRVTIVGGGGGGGGPGSLAGNIGIGGGGGGGQFRIKTIERSSLSLPVVITIGAGGTGGAGSNGTNGGTTSFGSIFTATGGNNGGTGGLAPVNSLSTGGSGGNNGTGTADITIKGPDGGGGWGDISIPMVVSHGGGRSPLNGASLVNTRANTVSFPGTTPNTDQYGAGGGGGMAVGQTTQTGANGIAGICIIEEFG